MLPDGFNFLKNDTVGALDSDESVDRPSGSRRTNGAARPTVEDQPRPQNDLHTGRPCACSLKARLIPVSVIDGATNGG